MTVQAWLDDAIQDAERRDLPALRPLLETLAEAISTLRAADWNDDLMSGETATDPDDR